MNETETFQHYQVLRREDGSLWELGRGAMGVTYKAFDVNLRCHVALKVISSQFLDSEMARARFLREARAAAGLRHRNVASVYHLGNDTESFFYSMEFIDGQTVEGLVNSQGPLPAVNALQIARQVTRALGAAAKQGVVHRDIKPANLMVVHEDDEEDEEGFVVKVIDFGLARSALGGTGEQSGHITMGGFVGTPQYASPEQIEEKDLDVRSDIYSLGITLWYMLAGQPPFTGTVFRISSQHLSKEPPWADIEAAVPEPVRALLGRMLQKDPAQRPQTPAKLRSEIEECLRQLPSAGGAHLVVAASAVSGRDTVLPEDSAVSATIIQGPAPTAGRIFAGRYQLNALVGEGASGQIFRAYDGRLDGKLVAVKVLHPELNLSPQAFYHLQGDLGRLRDAPHSQLIETYHLERVHGYKFSVMEWVNGYPLAALLAGSGGALPLREAFRLLGQAADAAAHCSAHRLHRLELSPSKILLHFADLDEEADAPSPATLSGNGPGQGPGFCLKIDALAPAREAGRTSARGSSGSSLRVTGRDTLTSIRGLVEGSYFYALGALWCELLGASPPAAGEAEQMPPVAGLSEAGNAVLRQAFSTNPGFATENEWFHALLKACELRREDVGLSRAAVEDPPPPAARTVARPGSTTTATQAPPKTLPVEARPTPAPASKPPETRVRPPAAPAPAKPAAPVRAPIPADTAKTLTRDEAATLTRPDPVMAPAAPTVVARAHPAPAPGPPEVVPPPPPAAPEPPVQREATPPPPVEPPRPASIPVAEPVLPVREDSALVEPPATGPEPVLSPEPLVSPPPALSMAEDFSEAATFAPLEPVPEPPVSEGAAAKAEPRTRKSFPVLPILAAAAVLLIGGGVAALMMSKSHPSGASTAARDPGKTPSPPPTKAPVFDHPAVVPPAVNAVTGTPLPTAAVVPPTPPPVETRPPALNTPPDAPAASPPPDAPAVMEVVPDTPAAPAATPFTQRPAATVGAAKPAPSVTEVSPPTPAPATSPFRENRGNGGLPSPKTVRPTPAPPKPEKTAPKPKPTPAKPLTATPAPRKNDDTPDFMR